MQLKNHKGKPLKAREPQVLSRTSPQLNFMHILKQDQDSQIYYPEANPQNSNLARGRWTELEKNRYVEFLCDHREYLMDKLTRKTERVFLQMSFSIPSRSAEQCRTHHQKMMKSKGCLDGIVAYHRRSEASLAEQRRERLAMARERRLQLASEQPFRLDQTGPNRLLLVLRTQSIQEY